MCDGDLKADATVGSTAPSKRPLQDQAGSWKAALTIKEQKGKLHDSPMIRGSQGTRGLRVIDGVLR